MIREFRSAHGTAFYDDPETGLRSAVLPAGTLARAPFPGSPWSLVERGNGEQILTVHWRDLADMVGGTIVQDAAGVGSIRDVRVEILRRLCTAREWEEAKVASSLALDSLNPNRAPA